MNPNINQSNISPSHSHLEPGCSSNSNRNKRYYLPFAVPMELPPSPPIPTLPALPKRPHGSKKHDMNGDNFIPQPQQKQNGFHPEHYVPLNSEPTSSSKEDQLDKDIEEYESLIKMIDAYVERKEQQQQQHNSASVPEPRRKTFNEKEKESTDSLMKFIDEPDEAIGDQKQNKRKHGRGQTNKAIPD